MKKIILKDWQNVEKLKNNFFAIICFAPRKSGKSQMIKYIYEKCKMGEEYDHIVVISESPDSMDHYSNFVHGNLFFTKFDARILENLIKQSQNLELEGKPKKFLLILDDTIGNDMKNNNSMMEIYAIGRHNRISCILITQKLTLINTTVRNNSDVILIGRTTNAGEKKSIIDNLLDGLADDEEIEKYGYKSSEKFNKTLIKQNTTDYNFIVIDNMDNNKINFDEIVYKYKAIIS